MKKPDFFLPKGERIIPRKDLKGGENNMERYGFKFKLFEEVTTKIKSDVRMMIVERDLVDCPGGTQRFYTVRAFIITKDYTQREPKLSPAMKLTRYNECELQLAN